MLNLQAGGPRFEPASAHHPSHSDSKVCDFGSVPFSVFSAKNVSEPRRSISKCFDSDVRQRELSNSGWGLRVRNENHSVCQIHLVLADGRKFLVDAQSGLSKDPN